MSAQAKTPMKKAAPAKKPAMKKAAPAKSTKAMHSENHHEEHHDDYQAGGKAHHVNGVTYSSEDWERRKNMGRSEKADQTKMLRAQQM